MVTLKCQFSLAILLVITCASGALGQKLAEKSLPSLIELNSVVGKREGSVPELQSPRVAIVIRIPESTIAKSLNRDFQNTEAVYREVLGTRAHGQARCHGSVTCVLEDNPDGASFCCHIEGTVHTEACGTNGPAIIKSKAKTNYNAFKRIVFNGTSFISAPATISLATELKITGIDSSLPALRGRIVRRVATRRAQQSHAQAEAITTSITREELSNRIDKEFATRLNDLNHKLAPSLSLIEHFRAAGNEIFIRSFKDSLEIGLVTTPLTRNDVAIHRVPIGESIELWIGKGRAEPLQEIAITQIPAITGMIGNVPHWLATYFSKNRQFSKLDEKTLKIDRQEDWLVFQLLD